jgi:di/tricarboxylate transporter
VALLIRRNDRVQDPAGKTKLRAGHNLILRGEPVALERLMGQAKLKLAHHERLQDGDAPDDDVGVMEAIVTTDSPLVDRSATQFRLYDRHQVNLLAISRSERRLITRLGTTRFRPGDVIVLQGNLKTMPEVLRELHCLPLAERTRPFAGGRHSLLPVVVLGGAMTLLALHLVPVAIAFFGAAVVLLLLRSLSLREAYDAIDWPLLVLIGALIPVSEALRTTGGTTLIADWLSAASSLMPPIGMLALIMIAAMAATPFLNNAATVLVMAPIAVSFAKTVGLSPDPFLMAVAIGAACDFLTPVGHQCNTLVMSAGGYRFGDYWKLGLPLSIMVVVVGTPLIALVWPLAAR